jgi:hypothetical protein
MAKTIMGHNIKSIREAAELALRIWTEAAGFFLSIELWLVVLAAFATVGGVWLAVMGDIRCLFLFAFAIGYMTVRPVLHAKGILKWPFI